MTDLLGRRVMESYMADWYAKIFPRSEYKQRYKEEKKRLQELTGEEYAALLQRTAEALSKLPCPECGCEQNGIHE